MSGSDEGIEDASNDALFYLLNARTPSPSLRTSATILPKLNVVKTEGTSEKVFFAFVVLSHGSNASIQPSAPPLRWHARRVSTVPRGPAPCAVRWRMEPSADGKAIDALQSGLFCCDFCDGKRQIEVLHEFQQCSSASIDAVTTPTTPSRSPSMDSSMSGRSTGSSIKCKYVIDELITTEQVYVRELREVIEFYIKPFEAAENHAQFPQALRGQTDIVFGNVTDLYDFHSRSILHELMANPGSISEMCSTLINRRNRFLALYRPYCQNKPLSEALRTEHVEGNKFFIDCQRRAGHLLPLSSYLLKPIQRITKYQLLLKELLRCCPEDVQHHVKAALASMLDLLSQLNADMHQLHISGFVGFN
uniref:DH domain-containing protein n=1 Tax=Panagrellus redivivus TaxID=6233 RepID=A0A7E4V5H9_PANRE